MEKDNPSQNNIINIFFFLKLGFVCRFFERVVVKCWSYYLVSCCKIICTSRFYWRYLILTKEALIFICSTWLWCPEGVTISVWGDSKGNAAHSRQQAKTDRSNKNQCITSYQSLQQPSPHSFLPSLPLTIPPSVPPLLSPSNPAFLFSFIFSSIPSLPANLYYSCLRTKCHICSVLVIYINKEKAFHLFANLQNYHCGEE